MRRITVDKNILARRFFRSMATYEDEAVVQKEIAAQLVKDLLSAAGTTRFDNVLELGCGTGLLTERLLEHCRPGNILMNDLIRECERTAQRISLQRPGLAVRFMHGDMEAIDFPFGQDLIMSSAVLQWVANPRDLLERMAGLLRPGGILALASFGPSNMREIAKLTGASLRYWSLAKWRATLADNCEVLVASESIRTIRFPSAQAMLRHLKQTGVNALDSKPWSRSDLLRFCRTYEETFGMDGQVPITYHPVSVIARKRGHGGAG